ncbi:hypothetical protein LX14_001379 [Williamsia deligens]|nr:hypothetical protein [Williamsia deligens]
MQVKTLTVIWVAGGCRKKRPLHVIWGSIALCQSPADVCDDFSSPVRRFDQQSGF